MTASPAKVIVISGPTAVGKTALSIDLALHLQQKWQRQAVVVNFDSLLFYHELQIGTCRPTQEEQRGVEHQLIGMSSVLSPLDAAKYKSLAIPLCLELLQQGKIPILVGGSGFYLQALLFGMNESVSPSAEVMKRSMELYHSQGIAPFLGILEEVDPLRFQQLHPNDHYRVRRAVEHYWSTQRPYSQDQQQKATENEQFQGKGNIHGWQLFHAFLDLPKDEHQRLIWHRTGQMLEQGLQQEVEALLQSGSYTGEERPLQSIGYKEMQAYLQGQLKSLEACREKIFFSTRQLAKSQRTWFQRISQKKQFHPLLEKAIFFHAVEEFLFHQSHE